MNSLPDKKSDPLAKLLGEHSLEVPPVNFTGDIMSKLGIASASVHTRYEPVIGIKGWILIGVISLVLILLSLTGGNSHNVGATGKIINTIQHTTGSVLTDLITHPAVWMVSGIMIITFFLFGTEAWYRTSRLKTQ